MEVIKLFIDDIINTLNTIQIDGENAFNTVKIYNNQVKKQLAGLDTFNYPACFIELKYLTGGNLGYGYTSNDIEIIFHIHTWELDSADGYNDKFLYPFKLRDNIKKTFTNYNPTNGSAMLWNGDRQDFNHDSIYSFNCRFKSHFIDTVGTFEDYEYEFAPSTYIYLNWEDVNINWEDVGMLWEDVIGLKPLDFLLTATFSNTV